MISADTTPPNRAYSPERFLAIAATAHLLVENIPRDAYPITDWEHLARLSECLGAQTLRTPAGRIGADAVSTAMPRIRSFVGSDLFPVNGPDDLAHKAGLVLVSLVVRRHAAKLQATPTPYKTKAEIQTAINSLKDTQNG